MLWCAEVFLLGMMAFWVRSDAESGATQLKCDASCLPDGNVIFRVSPAPTSNKSRASWTTKDGTAIAHYPGSAYNQTLVKDLTNRSITLFSWMDHLHFTSREWNLSSEVVMVSEAQCEANCTALVVNQTPPPVVANSTNAGSSDVICIKSMCLDKWGFYFTFFCVVLVVVLLLGLAFMCLKKWYNNRRRGCSTQTVQYTPADGEVKSQTCVETSKYTDSNHEREIYSEC